MERSNKPIDPYNYITLASAYMSVFRCKFVSETWSVSMKENAGNNCSYEVLSVD